MKTYSPHELSDDKRSQGYSPGSLDRIAGIVHALDLISRDLTVRLSTGLETFDIPPDCPVLLHGEWIKLRLVQLEDRVSVTFRKTCDRNIVERLEVQPDRYLGQHP